MQNSIYIGLRYGIVGEIGLANCVIQWSLPKRTLREADNPLQRTNFVARNEIAIHVILKQSPRSGQLRIPNNGQGTGPECVS